MFEGFTVESDHAPYSFAEKGWTFTARAPRRQAEIDAVLATVAPPKLGYAGLFAAMGDALDGRPGREVTLEDGRRSLEFVTACYASAREGRPVTLPLGPGHPLYGSWLPQPLGAAPAKV
jgi:predicted dehydrogenase